MSSSPTNKRWYDGYVFFGIVFGTVIGGIVRVWTSRRSGTELRQQIKDQITPSDTIDDSLEAGKAAARRLQQS
jgi:gas vesicle protein